MRLVAFPCVWFVSLTCGRGTAHVVESKKSPRTSAQPESPHLLKIHMASKFKESHPKGLDSLASLMLLPAAVGFNTYQLLGPSQRVGPSPRMAFETLEAVRGPMLNWPKNLGSHAIQNDEDFDSKPNWAQALDRILENDDGHALDLFIDGPRGSDRLLENHDGDSLDGLFDEPKSLVPANHFKRKTNWAKTLTTQGSDRTQGNDSRNSFGGFMNSQKNLAPQGSLAIQKKEGSNYFNRKPNWAKTLTTQSSGRLQNNDGLMTRPKSVVSQGSHAMRKNDDANDFDIKAKLAKAMRTQGSGRNWAKTLTQGSNRILDNGDGNAVDGLMRWPTSFASPSHAMQKSEGADYFNRRPNWAKTLTTILENHDGSTDTPKSLPSQRTRAVQMYEEANFVFRESNWARKLTGRGADRILENGYGNSFDGLTQRPTSFATPGSHVMQKVEGANYVNRKPNWAKILTTQGSGRIVENSNGNSFDDLMQLPQS